MTSDLPTRLVVVPVILDASDRVLLCRMVADRGVFPGQWALPGGGLEPGERIEEALEREVREELGVELARRAPLLFKDAVLPKRYPDGRTLSLHMVFLVYLCSLAPGEIVLNEEFSEYRWCEAGDLAQMELTSLTRETLASVVGRPRAPSAGEGALRARPN